MKYRGATLESRGAARWRSLRTPEDQVGTIASYPRSVSRGGGPRLFELAPGRRVGQGFVVLRHGLAPAILAGQKVAPGLERLGPVGTAFVGGLQLGGGAGEIAMPGQGESQE